MKRHLPRYAGFILLLLIASACAPVARQVIPTERPTVTPTATATATATRGPRNATPTVTVTRPPASPTGGPSPTPLLGATSTPDDDVTPTRVPNPNAPRIEFFTSDVQAVAPGSDVSLFWSTRGADGATIYKLDPAGTRNQLWNVPPDGSLTVSTLESERGTANFLLTVGEGAERTEQPLSLPLSCPVTWFFVPPPQACPNDEPLETRIIEQPFVRGRMLYIAEQNQVYALFNDGFEPAWVVFRNQYNPAIHDAFLEGFPVPPGRFQPRDELGFVWRGNDLTRNRLGLATDEATGFDGFLQTAPAGDEDSVYVTSADGNVLQILPDGENWEIITLPDAG